MIYTGNVFDILPTLETGSVHTCVTSPPYFGLRDYGADGQIGLEETPEEYVTRLVQVFREVRRVLRNDGTLWLNLGDSYAGSGRGRGGTFDSERPAWTQVPDKRIERGHGRWGGGNNPATGIIKPKDMLGIPWRVAFALQADGWYLRSDIIWHKPNAMPESVRDRPTKAHEYIFLLSKSAKYYYDADSIKEPAQFHAGNAGTFQREGSKREQPIPGQKYGTHRPNRTRKQDQVGRRTYTGFNERYLETPPGMWRNKRTVWTVSTKPFRGAHFATFPEDLIEPCIQAGCPPDGIVLDPFFGSGTTGVVAQRLDRNYIGIELNPAYVEIAKSRIEAAATTKPLEL